MNIAITTPNYWPYFRRGTARFVNTLANFLAGKGHRITILTAKPGPKQVNSHNGVVLKYFPYHQHPLLLQHRVHRRHFFAGSIALDLLSNRYDLIYCLSHTEGYAAHLVKRMRNIRYISNITSVPFRNYFADSRLDERMFLRGVGSADALMFPSRYSKSCLDFEVNAPSEAIPMPVDRSLFGTPVRKDPKRPMILFVSDLGDRRKGLSVLLKAFTAFRRKVPEALLILAGQSDIPTRRHLTTFVEKEGRGGIFLLGQGRIELLPHLYSIATMTVLPSLYEVFGMVLIESLAAGTPVVASRSGALPEIVTSSEVGALFDPIPVEGEATNAEGLYQAMLEVHQESIARGAGDRCRDHARQYDISRIGPRFEEFFSRYASPS